MWQHRYTGRTKYEKNMDNYSVNYSCNSRGGLDNNKLTRMVCKGNDWSVVEELKNASMGRTKTLSDFIKWGTKEYPADKYFLII